MSLRNVLLSCAENIQHIAVAFSRYLQHKTPSMISFHHGCSPACSFPSMALPAAQTFEEGHTPQSRTIEYSIASFVIAGRRQMLVLDLDYACHLGTNICSPNTPPHVQGLSCDRHHGNLSLDFVVDSLRRTRCTSGSVRDVGQV